eukprot:CAMPEP_0174286194 /NCGR_PEP_ID=MMETSP0809-20121228/10848_1 /TAXON_ID=73025 ORGANISM="Eutreptiella gymnastica-like, Strain CCMP1594" /NCGR_SAMPLE_ID=MMETSP0809 /ASSEMBLY_ACC=CAM_ASM_000658 /LENGTH=159 /DNA_ID=CAMNT_0015382171 /DNA_START=41 /DNA_END=520 /DNA_ORIENTATION=+
MARSTPANWYFVHPLFGISNTYQGDADDYHIPSWQDFPSITEEEIPAPIVLGDVVRNLPREVRFRGHPESGGTTYARHIGGTQVRYLSDAPTRRLTSEYEYVPERRYSPTYRTNYTSDFTPKTVTVSAADRDVRGTVVHGIEMVPRWSDGTPANIEVKL